MVFTPIRRDADTERFFESTQRREFPLATCTACGAVGGPQETICYQCGAAELTWSTAAAGAVVRSWIVMHGKPGADGTEPPTKVIVIGELYEGPWWWAPLLDPDDRELADGTPLILDFAPAGEELLPAFRLAPDRA
jgi:hypothetical protein